MELAITFSPLDDASALGYYRRLACANALWNWKELARLAEVSPSRTGLLGQPEHVAEVLRLDPAWTQDLTQREATARGWRGLHRRGHDAVCPDCLQESGHLRVYWEHAYAVACHRHGKLLTDRCEACGEYLAHTREHIEFCQCGHDLRSQFCAAASPAQLWLANLLATDGASSGAFEPHLRSVTVSDASLMVRTLCQHADPDAAGPRRNCAAPTSVHEALEFLRPLNTLLADWPTKFEAHVSDRIASASPDARTLNSLLGRWYQKLKSVAVQGPLQVFLKPVIDVASREFNGVIDHVTAADLGAETHMAVVTAAKTLGLGRDALVEHLKAGRAHYRTKRFGARGVCYDVPVEEVQRIQALRQRWSSSDMAAAQLGIGPAVLTRMSEVGLVVIDAAWRTDLFKGGPVLLESVMSMEQSVRAHLKKSKTSESTIALRDLNSRNVGDKRAIQSVLRAIHGGELCAVAGGERIGSYRFKVSEVKRYFGRPVLEAGLSVNQLAKLTGWKWETVRHWIDEGLLESHEILLRGQLCRVVMPEQLLAFSQTYVPLTTLAHALDSRSSALLERLGEIRLLGGKPLPSGAVRGALVRMSDLAHAALLPGIRKKGA